MEAPTPKSEEISETIIIEHHSDKYTLNLNSIGDIITFSLDYNSNNYTKKITLKEIKDTESNPIFSFQLIFLKIQRNLLMNKN